MGDEMDSRFGAELFFSYIEQPGVTIPKLVYFTREPSIAKRFETTCRTCVLGESWKATEKRNRLGRQIKIREGGRLDQAFSFGEIELGKQLLV
jgi:hypothetical protein